MPNLVTGKYINGYSAFKCICGSKVQSRNINNHFTTAKHSNFLLNSKGLKEEYEDITVDQIAFKLRTYRQNVKKTEKFNIPITLYFD